MPTECSGLFNILMADMKEEMRKWRLRRSQGERGEGVHM